MDVSALVKLCIAVISDWHVIAAAAITIMFISLANYVVRYRKKPPRIKSKPEKKPAAPAAPADGEKKEGEAAAESAPAS